MEAIINDYISKELVQDPALLPLANDTSLLETGVLDSLSLLSWCFSFRSGSGLRWTMWTSSPSTSTAWMPFAPTSAPGLGKVRARRAAVSKAAATQAADPAGPQRLGGSARQRAADLRRLLSNAEGLCLLAGSGAAGSSPARQPRATVIACWRGDWIYRRWTEKRSEIMFNLRELLGE